MFMNLILETNACRFALRYQRALMYQKLQSGFIIIETLTQICSEEHK